MLNKQCSQKQLAQSYWDLKLCAFRGGLSLFCLVELPCQFCLYMILSTDAQLLRMSAWFAVRLTLGSSTAVWKRPAATLFSPWQLCKVGATSTERDASPCQAVSMPLHPCVNRGTGRHPPCAFLLFPCLAIKSGTAHQIGMQDLMGAKKPTCIIYEKRTT